MEWVVAILAIILGGALFPVLAVEAAYLSAQHEWPVAIVLIVGAADTGATLVAGIVWARRLRRRKP